MTYWEKRVLRLSNQEFKKSKELIDELIKFYNEERDVLQEKIYNHLLKVQDEQGLLSITEAKRLLNNRELSVFKRGLAEFEAMSKGDISKETEKKLQLMSRRVRISRLQAMEFELEKSVDKLMNIEERKLSSHLSKAYKGRYYKELYDLQRITDYGFVESISQRKLNTIIQTPWTSDGREFSSRIWTRRDKLTAVLKDNLMKDFARGSSLDETVDKIAKEFETTKANAARLVYTEATAISSKATMDSYKELGIEHYEILATLDLRTSEICRDMDKKVFEMKDYRVGVTAPPFHPNCRTTTVPYFDDDIQRDIDRAVGRMSRDPITGKSVRVKDMSYQEWYKRYVIN